MKILLIAGHGDGDPGAEAFWRKECDLTREVVQLIHDELKPYDIEVCVFDKTKSAVHELKTGKYINFKPYKYVLEVHFNAFKVDKGNGKTTGTEIYVNNSEKEVSVENAILKNITSLGFRNRGIKYTDKLLVIKTVKSQGVSSALLEVCFMDDADDMKIYNSKKKQIAKAIANGIVSGFKVSKKETVNVNEFVDINGHWAKEYIEQVAGLGIVKGYADDTFRPDKPITRAEIAVIISRLIKLLK